MLAILLVFLVIHIYDRRIEHLEKVTHSGVSDCRRLSPVPLPHNPFNRHAIFINS